MEQKEIERIKQGLFYAISKAPGNQILRDLETAILTVEQLQVKQRETELQVRELHKYVADLGCEKPVRCPTLLDDKNFDPCGECMPCKAVMAGAYIAKQVDPVQTDERRGCRDFGHLGHRVSDGLIIRCSNCDEQLP